MNTSSLLNVQLIQVNDNDLPPISCFAIIAAFNHEKVIASVILQTKQHVDRVIVVDDGSDDQTPEIARLAGAEVIRLDYTTGKAYSLLLGLRYARDGKCNVAVTIDANGQHNPVEIARVIGPIIDGNADFVIGSRYLNKQESLQSYKKNNKILLESGTKITDSSSSFLAFSQKALASLDFPIKGFNINRDFISFFDKQGFKISEVSITPQKRHIQYSMWDFPIKVLAAMPAYNEEKHIAKIILQAQQFVDCVLVVDDGSKDSTKEIAKKLGAMVISHKKNFGYGSALNTIFEKAKKLDIDMLVICDSDGQHDPKDIPSLLNRLEKGDVDVVIGSRFIQGKQGDIPRYRIFGMKVLDHATKIAGAYTTTDSQSGFRAYGKKAINTIHISKEGMSAGSEILIQIAENNLKIAEIPILTRYDLDDTSSQNPVAHGFLVLYNIIGMISYRRPLLAFGIPGFILVIIGFILGSLALTEYYASSTFPFVLSSSVFVMMGVFLIVAALILNYLVNFVADQRTGRFRKKY
jgi:glycosyltransferase involved in cell wall biosynthesis